MLRRYRRYTPHNADGPDYRRRGRRERWSAPTQHYPRTLPFLRSFEIPVSEINCESAGNRRLVRKSYGSS